MHLAELGEAQGKIAVAFQAVLEDMHMARAVHGLEGIDALVRRLSDIHVIAKLLPMSRLLPQRSVEHVRRVDLDIAPGLLATAHVADQRLKQGPALGMPEHGARSLLLEMEQIHLAAQATVVALLGLFGLMQIASKLLLARPGGAVDALEHRVVGVPAPLGAGDLEQLEAFADLSRRGHMRAAAEIEPFGLRIDLDLLSFGDGVDQLEL